jgi:hypothetical protein
VVRAWRARSEFTRGCYPAFRRPCYLWNVGSWRLAIVGLAVSLPVAAQVIVNAARLAPLLRTFDEKPGETALRCDVTPIRPALNYGFRFQAGYRVVMPANQFLGPKHRWFVLTRITPKAAGGQPVYLANSQVLTNVPQTTMQLQFGGGYLLGEGAYDVNWVLFDERDRVCRSNWHVDVHRNRHERSVEVAMPPDTVWDFSLRGARLLPRNPDDAASLRLTLLLNAAPMFPRRTHLRPGDIGALISAASSLLERVPARNVRLVLFNLEQQKELYRNTDFMLENMPEVAQAMNSIELNTVDFQVLQNRRGHVDLLADLVRQELKAEPPSDVVLFLGPSSRYEDRIPADLLERAPGRAPQFMDIQILPLFAPAPSFPDVIRNAISRLGGKTVQVRSPGEFAKAIARLERMPR